VGIFDWKGDAIARHNVGVEPMLSPFSSAFFLLGILLSIVYRRKPFAIFLVLYLLIMLVPGMLAVDAPNAPRVLGSVPPALLLTSLGIFGAVRILAMFSVLLSRIFGAVILAGNLVTGPVDALFRQPQVLDSLPVKTAELWGMDREPENIARL